MWNHLTYIVLIIGNNFFSECNQCSNVLFSSFLFNLDLHVSFILFSMWAQFTETHIIQSYTTFQSCHTISKRFYFFLTYEYNFFIDFKSKYIRIYQITYFVFLSWPLIWFLLQIRKKSHIISICECIACVTMFTWISVRYTYLCMSQWLKSDSELCGSLRFMLFVQSNLAHAGLVKWKREQVILILN